MPKRFIAAILVTMIVGPLSADPLTDAIQAYESGDYETALRTLRPLAEGGDAGAQHQLAEMYLYGRGLPQDDAEFLKWYRRASDQWPTEGWWLVLPKDGYTDHLAFTECDPDGGDPWVECVGFGLGCSELVIVSDLRSNIIVKRLVASTPYSDGNLLFKIRNRSFSLKSYGFQLAYNDMNGAWDLTIEFSDGRGDLFRALASDSAGSVLEAIVMGETLDLTPRESEWPTLVEFARGCGSS